MFILRVLASPRAKVTAIKCGDCAVERKGSFYGSFDLDGSSSTPRRCDRNSLRNSELWCLESLDAGLCESDLPTSKDSCAALACCKKAMSFPC
eukprot:4130910-Amphidinium_carterae.1